MRLVWEAEGENGKGRWEKQAGHGGTEYEVGLWRKNECVVQLLFLFFWREDERGLQETKFRG
jgi:hypothetical protein